MVQSKRKRNTRKQRWSDACVDAEKALTTLVELQYDYEEWLQNIPPGLEESPMGEKLTAIVDLDIQGMLDSLEEIAMIDLPMGFGRD